MIYRAGIITPSSREQHLNDNLPHHPAKTLDHVSFKSQFLSMLFYGATY